ncbi:MAG: IS200/IS605 family transposase [Parcubacteria group bacterium]|nr:IS200/IS605 family transposase [Parcubacteria group bacterium]
MELGKTSHCVYKIRYHIVTAVKYRKLLLTPPIEKCIKQALKGISERYNIIIDEVGFDQDHIHICCGAKPSYSPTSVINIVKSITAKQVFKQFPELKKKELWGGEFWSDGKYIGTIGEASNEEVIKKYIRNQAVNRTEDQQRVRQLKLFKL